MMEFFERALVIGTVGWVLIGLLGICCYTLISQMLEDHVLAMVGTPILLLGALLTHQGFREFGTPLSSDKGIAMAIAFMIGLVATSIVLAAIGSAVSAARAR